MGSQRTVVSRVLIDGRNVQRALERGSPPGSLPTFALIARLRGAFPGIAVELILDGHGGGSPSGRVAPGFSVTFSRSLSADRVISDRVAELAREVGPAASDGIVVVSDDREVRDDARRRGARVEGTAWLVARLDSNRAVDGREAASGASPRPGTALGHGRPPRRPRTRRGGC